MFWFEIVGRLCNRGFFFICGHLPHQIMLSRSNLENPIFFKEYPIFFSLNNILVFENDLLALFALRRI